MATVQDAVRALEANDFAAARAHAARAARAGDPHAMQLLGRWHAAGAAGCEPDPGLAAYWFFQAWQVGLDEAEQDIIRAREALGAAAEAGSASAQNALGLIVMFGHDDPAAAAEWFGAAAAQGHPEALRMLGYLAAEGRGVPKDEAAAAGYFERAAFGGDTLAMFQFARLLDEGRGVPARDRDGAIRWLRRAATQGMADAEQPLADLLAERNRDRRDANEAVQRIVRFARGGPPDATYRLAAGDGSWVVTVADRGETVSMTGLRPEELVGLPDED